MGNPKNGVLIPIAPSIREIPDGYIDMRDTIIAKIKESRVRFTIQANSGVMEIYWDIGSNMKKFAASWSDFLILQRVVAKIPW